MRVNYLLRCKIVSLIRIPHQIVTLPHISAKLAQMKQRIFMCWRLIVYTCQCGMWHRLSKSHRISFSYGLNLLSSSTYPLLLTLDKFWGPRLHWMSSIALGTLKIQALKFLNTCFKEKKTWIQLWFISPENLVQSFTHRDTISCFHMSF